MSGRAVGAAGLWLLAAAASPGQQAATPPRTIVIGPGFAPSLALAPCTSNREDARARDACASVGETLRSDLDFEGLFRLDEEAPELAVETRIEVLEDRLTAAVKVRAKGSAQALLERRYEGQAKAPRSLAHLIADEITALTQYRGVARSRIAFISDRAAARGAKDVYIVDYDGHDPERRTAGDRLNLLPAWSPDGRTLAFVSFHPNPDIFLTTGDKQPPLNLTSGRGMSFSPSFSPDGDLVTFASSRSGEQEIWVANRDGSGQRQLTSGKALNTAPCFSPTGREIAFASDRSGFPQLYLMDAEGLGLRHLPTPSRYVDAPAWNPSKEHTEIAYSFRAENGLLHVAVLTLPEGPNRVVSDEGTSCESPSWAPNGRHLVFSCQTAAGWQLFVSDREGRRRRQLTSGPGDSVQPDWGP